MSEIGDVNTNMVSKLVHSSSQNADILSIIETVIKEYKAKDTTHKVPFSILANSDLGVLETIVKYLKENKNLKYNEIAQLLNRDDRTIWSTYSKAVKKKSGKLDIINNGETFDPSIFSNRKQAPLEAVITHLKERGKTNREIATILNRSYKTVWLIVNKKKRGK